MAARSSRPRAGQLKDDADEERGLWNQLRGDAKKVDALMAKSDEVTRRILELIDEQSQAEGRGAIPSLENDALLETALRENIRLTESILSLTSGDADSHPSTILDSLEILAALRGSTEPDLPPTSISRSASQAKPSRNPKRKLDAMSGSGAPGLLDPGDRSVSGLSESALLAVDSPAVVASPKVSGLSSSATGRLKASSRAGSVPIAREASVKTEDGADEIASNSTTLSHATQNARATPLSSSDRSDRHKFHVGTEVFYRQNGSKKGGSYALQNPTEGEGILCSVTSVIGEGKQRRYEIIDSDPDPPTPPQPYRASVSAMIAIPANNNGLPDLPKGKAVLALYPGTTTFYKAEVTMMGTGKKGERKEGSPELKEGFVRLRFEGEEEAEREMDVERRYVLVEGGR